MSKSGEIIDPTMLKILRLVRLLRLARLLRAFAIFDVLHLLISSLKSSFTVLMWSGVFLFAVMTMFGLLLQTTLEPYIQDPNSENRYEVFQYFGTFSRSVLSVWYVTLANPAPIVWLLVDNVSEQFIWAFLLHHSIFGFAVITVVRAIFLHETFKVSETDKDIMIRAKERQISRNAKHMLALFEQADLDDDGMVRYREFCDLVRDPKMNTFICALGLEVRDAEEVFRLLDTNGDGELNINTLMDGFTRIKGTARSIDIVQTMDVIRRVENDVKLIGSYMGIPDQRDQKMQQQSQGVLQGSNSMGSGAASCTSLDFNSNADARVLT